MGIWQLRSKPSLLRLALLAALLLAGPPPPPSPSPGQSQRLAAGQPPAGLSAADWQSIREQIAAGAQYPLTIGPLHQWAYLKASNSGAGDFFGGSVAVSGDTLVVGAYREDSSATGVNGNQADNSASDAGAAYVFGDFVLTYLPVISKP